MEPVRVRRGRQGRARGGAGLPAAAAHGTHPGQRPRAGNPLRTLVPVGYPPVHVYEIDAIVEAIEDTSEETFLFAHHITLCS